MHKILRFLPETKASFAYGSGIFQQQNHSFPSSNMLDIIFITDNSLEWHKENLKLNPHHYSFLKIFGSKRIAYIQEQFGAGVYFNTMLEINGRSVKYGVVSEHSFFKDLFSWKFLYLGGRLHKPVKWLTEKEPAFFQAVHYNLNAALLTALLLLPESFSEQELYITIASLSYTGDFRMNIGEDRRKVSNIVLGNVIRFRELYSKVISENTHNLKWDKEKQIYTQNMTSENIFDNLKRLPEHLQAGLLTKIDNPLDQLKELSQNKEKCSLAVKKQLVNITKSSSWSQSIKSFFSAGLIKSIKYAGKKLVKHYKSL